MKTSPDNTRWTGDKAADFLKALARCGKVAIAARSVGMSRQAAYRLRARAPNFAQMWDLAMQQAEASRAAALKQAGKRTVHPLLARPEELAEQAARALSPDAPAGFSAHGQGDIQARVQSHMASRAQSHRRGGHSHRDGAK